MVGIVGTRLRVCNAHVWDCPGASLGEDVGASLHTVKLDTIQAQIGGSVYKRVALPYSVDGRGSQSRCACPTRTLAHPDPPFLPHPTHGTRSCWTGRAHKPGTAHTSSASRWQTGARAEGSLRTTASPCETNFQA